MGYVQQVMKSKYGMQEVWIGDDRKPNGPKCNIFISPDFYENQGRCLVLIKGSAPSIAGTWARSELVNTSLNMGSVLPYIEYAQTMGQSVIILNPDVTHDSISKQAIPHCSDRYEHSKYVWENFLT